MKNFQIAFSTFLLAVVISLDSFATWSIIVIDPVTKQIGMAGASCTFSVYGIGGIIPGKGAIIVQAMSNKAAKAKGLQMILVDAPPNKILETIRDKKFYPEEQQYAIVSLNYLDKPVTYTGKLTNGHKGSLTAKGISVQGNTLTDVGELEAILNAVIKAQKEELSLEEILMQALEAGAAMGGDKRCGNQRASSAFLTIAKPDDNFNKPFLNLIVYGTEKNVNAVATLRKKLDNWKNKKEPMKLK